MPRFFEIAPGVMLGKGVRSHDVSELRIQMELLKFSESDLYVFRARTSLATMAYLEKHKLHFKAEVWQSAPAMKSAKAVRMPADVKGLILNQVSSFVHAWREANPQSPASPETKSTRTITEKSADVNSAAEKVKLTEQQQKYKYVASKNSGVFHKPGCSWAQRIKKENLVGYNTREEAIKAGKRPCKRCNP